MNKSEHRHFATLVKNTVRFYANHGGFRFGVSYLNPDIVIATIDSTWEIISITSNEKNFSFTLKKDNNNPIVYEIRGAVKVSDIQRWFETVAKNLKAKRIQQIKAGKKMPKRFIFSLKIKEFSI